METSEESGILRGEVTKKSVAVGFLFSIPFSSPSPLHSSADILVTVLVAGG